uniref:Homeobox domain-containing protein n=1 Tax=Kalanchoe fedtschenkoi TaxID=63787 RepID=A0A7N1A8A4_KALFE
MEWEKQPPQHHHHHVHSHGGDALIGEGAAAAAAGLLQEQLVVMTDEQIEILRKQIAVYTVLCDKLVEMHRSLSSQRDLSGVRFGNTYCDQLLISSGHKISARQRWAPTPAQLQILENIFDKGNGTPSKQKIKDITSELSQHGQVSETNVYNWFQNRRARAKRKQTVPATNNNETDGIKEVDSSNEKKAKEENFQSHQIPCSLSDDSCYQSSAMNSDLHSFDPLSSKAEAMFSSEDDLKPPTTLGDISFYDSILSNRRVDQLSGAVEVEGGYHPYHQTDDYNLMG